MTNKKNLHQRVIGFAAMAVSVGAVASLQLPPQPVGPQQFDSFLACEAYLNQRHADDLQGTDGPPTRLENGGTREKFLRTDGVQRTGPETARYKARITWVVRFINKARHAKQINSPFEEVDLTCTGPIMQGMTRRGQPKPMVERLPEGTEENAEMDEAPAQ